MSLTTTKKLLLSMIVVGLLGSLTARGTYAILTSESANANTSAASGTLVLDNTLSGGSGTCTSKGGAGNVNILCDALFSTTTLYPITSTTPTASSYGRARITIKNHGSLPGTLSLYMPSCAGSTTTGATVVGGTNPCCPGGTFPCATGSLDFFIQEYTSGSFGTALSSCYWPADPSNPCAFTDDSLGGFYTFHHDNTHYLSLGTIAASTSRWFIIGVAEPIDAGPGLQGETATLSVYWHLNQ